jgi:hypothetical protein
VNGNLPIAAEILNRQTALFLLGNELGPISNTIFVRRHHKTSGERNTITGDYQTG